MPANTSTTDVESQKKPTTHKGGLGPMCIVAVLVVFIIVAAAVAVPIGIIFGRSDSPSTLSVQVTFTASGDISDYPTATQDLILGRLSTAAGFAVLPEGSTITLTSASVHFLANFPVADTTAQNAAKASLGQVLSGQTSAQAYLRTAVPTITLEAAPSIDNADSSLAAAPPPPPFALVGHWLTAYDTAYTYTNTNVVSISNWGRVVLPITSYTDTYYIIQQPASDTYNPRRFQKVFFHTHTDGSIATCTSLRNATTEEDAIAHDGVGTYNRDGTECGAFTHTLMNPFNNPVAGTWTTDGGYTLTITNERWLSVHPEWGSTDRTIRAFGEHMVIAQLPSDDAYNADAWQKIEFHDRTATGFSYCTTTFNSPTLLHAVEYDSAGEGAYDTTNATHGCGTNNFAHSVASSS